MNLSTSAGLILEPHCLHDDQDWSMTLSTSAGLILESHCLQDDKDLVHEFVNNDGLDCLIKVGAEADQNYQNYILRGMLCTEK